MSILPNFFVVGTGKAGTTSLYRYLQQHPQIYMSPIKEPAYFASEIRPENLSEPFERHVRWQSLDRANPLGWLVSEWDDYQRLFDGAKDQKAIGEATTAYLWSETAARNIHSRIPEARIVMILRDPAERAFSHYLHHLAEGLTRSTFREQIEKSARAGGRKLGVLYPFLEIGLYHNQVKRYIELFPRDRIRIYWYEEAWRQPARLLADLFEFLGVDAAFRPDTSRKSLQRRAPRVAAVSYFLNKFDLWSPLKQLVPERLRPGLRGLAYRRGDSLVMDPSDRRYLIEYYAEDVRKLSSLLERDLSAWLR
jgi:Sulfotransferase family